MRIRRSSIRWSDCRFRQCRLGGGGFAGWLLDTQGLGAGGYGAAPDKETAHLETGAVGYRRGRCGRHQSGLIGFYVWLVDRPDDAGEPKADAES